jgi:hypothetical protein
MTTGRVTVRGNRALLANFSFISGGRSDLRSLLRFHYRAAMPATVALVLCAFERERGGEGASRARSEPAAVLCVSYPVLNAPWRAVAWPELLNADARTLNACVRCISRVVVDPRYRGIGLSSELVRRYLRTPITVYTESLAAMGGACPFLRAAGMREIELKRSARDERLLRDLRRLGLNPARALCGVQVVEHRVRLGRKVRACALRWAKASKATARGAETRTTTELLQEACGALRPTRLVYVHTSGASESNTSINQGEGGE